MKPRPMQDSLYGHEPADALPGSADPSFVAFHDKHPDLYATLVFLARQARAQGQVFGIQTFWELTRFTFVQAKVPLVMPDRFQSLYARRIMAQEPDLARYFITRARRSKAAT